MTKGRRTYSFDLKKQVVEMYFEGYTVKDLVEKFDIKNRRRVYDWTATVREYGYDGLYDARGSTSTGKKKKQGKTSEETYERLELENLYLKKLLDLNRGWMIQKCSLL